MAFALPDQEPKSSLTFGEQLVGASFNPSRDSKVDKAKQLCAALADILQDEWLSAESSPMKEQLYNHAVGEILNAQMSVVKVLTLKY
jgi:hypothetical protein